MEKQILFASEKNGYSYLGLRFDLLLYLAKKYFVNSSRMESCFELGITHRYLHITHFVNSSGKVQGFFLLHWGITLLLYHSMIYFGNTFGKGLVNYRS